MALALMHTAKQAKKNGSRVGHLLFAIALIGVAISPLAGCGKGSGAGTGTGGGAGTGTGGRQSGSGGQTGGQSGSAGKGDTSGASGSMASGSGGSAASGGIGSGGSSGSGGTSTGGAGTGGVGGAGGRAGSGGAAGKGGAQSSGGQTGTGGSSNPDGGQPDALRLIQNFNQSWKFKTRRRVRRRSDRLRRFRRGSDIGLPHSFNLPYFMNAKFYVGYGWYRKHFAVPVDLVRQERVSRVPGRVRSGADLRQRQEGRRAHRRLQRILDRRHVRHQDRRQRRGRSIEQQLERSDPAHHGRSHVPGRSLSRRVRRGDGPAARHLVRHLGHDAHARDESGSSSTVSIKTEVQNNRSAAVNATLKTDIVDKDGKVVATISSQQQIDARQDGDLRPDHAGDQQPRRCGTPIIPTLYKALSYLSDGSGNRRTTFTTPFGFRWFSWSATKGSP